MSYQNNPHHYLVPQQRIPGYLPYPQPVSPGNIAVPNEAFGFWPQGQFAPQFFPPGHASFSPYRYPDFQDDEVVWNGVEFSEENPSIDFDTRAVLMTVGVFALGYITAKYGWDQKLRAAIKTRL
tara:strand:+ start:1004 stop:1375 length:372 start_codon:yes stop_codon:yes gene_type:complete